MRTKQPWTRPCPACGTLFTGFARNTCPNPECKKKPLLATAEGVIELAGFRVRVILEPIT
jgi:hypothetical protein